ncbi:ArsR/SmtB family transcription factor [Streptomyces phaeochromogenes]|uniref:ArsR/SmtB family transcription factor n=1 Tax=Streptomyces phaeochromogenes TaxID=1923 RepID=UPI00398D3A6D
MPSPITDFAQRTGIAPAAVSHHITVLHDAGLITTRHTQPITSLTCSEPGPQKMRVAPAESPEASLRPDTTSACNQDSLSTVEAHG